MCPFDHAKVCAKGVYVFLLTIALSLGQGCPADLPAADQFPAMHDFLEEGRQPGNGQSNPGQTGPVEDDTPQPADNGGGGRSEPLDNTHTDPGPDPADGMEEEQEPPTPTQPVDHCPYDPHKTEPGACGCGIPDADGDGNGVADCQESSEPPAANRATGCEFLAADAYAALPATPPTFAAGRLPTQADLSTNMPPVGDQGAIGSCVAWAVGYATASQTANSLYQWGFNSTDTIASPAWLYGRTLEVERRQSSCGDGTYPADALNILMQEGCASWTTVPYNDRQCFFNLSGYQTESFRIGSYQAIKPATDHNMIKSSLAAGKPVIIAVMLNQDFGNYRTGVYRSNPSSGGMGGHAMVIVGYDDGRGAYKIMNSWGTGWGEGGFCWWAYKDIAEYLWEAYTVEPARNPSPKPGPNPQPQSGISGEILDAFQLWYVDAFGYSYVYLIFEYELSDMVYIREVKVTDPYGRSARQVYNQWFEYGHVWLVRTDGYQWNEGTFTLTFDAVLRDGGEVTLAGSVHVGPLARTSGGKSGKNQRVADHREFPAAGMPDGVLGPLKTPAHVE